MDLQAFSAFTAEEDPEVPSSVDSDASVDSAIVAVRS